MIRRLRRFAGAVKRDLVGRRRHETPKAAGNAPAKDTSAALPVAGLGDPRWRLPVVLISFNRGPMLRKVVEGYRRQTVPVDVFVHDNGSEDPETVRVLAELEREGVVVFRRAAISSPEDLNLVDESVQAVFRDRPASPYAVSDCDVSIADSSERTLETYLQVLADRPELDCVGPMLRIDDVPTTYPLYSAMMNRHIGRFWSREPQLSTVAGRPFAYQAAPIDTTLAVYRAGEPYRRLRKGARLYFPYDARHLDWYPDEHQDAYRQSADGSTISNWSNPARERASRFTTMESSEYRTVVEGPDGGLVVETRSVAPVSGARSADLLSVMEDIMRDLEPSWPGLMTRAWVWRDTVGVVDAQLASGERLGLDLIPGAGERWAVCLVARTDPANDVVSRLGLDVIGRRRYLVREVQAGQRSVPDPVEAAEAFRTVLEQLIPVDPSAR